MLPYNTDENTNDTHSPNSQPGQMFSNWKSLTFDVPNLKRDNKVVIENTSRTGPTDWIAFDWMELIFVPR